jgi:hypothetical protein
MCSRRCRVAGSAQVCQKVVNGFIDTAGRPVSETAVRGSCDHDSTSRDLFVRGSDSPSAQPRREPQLVRRRGPAVHGP